MTMLNGEPVDTPNISTAHPAAPTASGQSQSVGFIVLGINLFTGIVDICQQLGPGTHQQNGVTYTCG